MSTGEPVYLKLKNDILELIESGRLLPGDMLPSENEQAKKYGISRGSARRALAELESEKLIKKLSGKGTVVCDSADIDKFMKIKTIGIDIAGYFGSNGRYYQEFLNGAKKACREANCKIQLISNDDLADIDKISLDGLIIMHYEDNAVGKLASIAEKFPVVIVNRFINRGKIGWVSIDNVTEAFRAVEYLIQQGHRRIAFVGNTNKDGILRLKGYTSALKTYGIPIEQELIVAQSLQNEVFNAVAHMIKNAHPSAIISMSGYYHVNFVDPIIRGLQLKIPEEISLMCFDDIEGEFFYYGPPLTCVRQPMTEMGRAAIIRLATSTDFPIKEKFHAELVIRYSCLNITSLLVDHRGGKAITSS